MDNNCYLECDDFAYIRRCSNENCNSDEFEGHTHPYHEIYISVSGKTRFVTEGVSFNLNPYDILIIPPYKLHLSQPKSEAYFDSIIIKVFPSMYHGIYSDEIIDMFKNSDHSNSKIPGHIVKRSEIPQILEYIQSHINDNNPYVLPVIRSKIFELLYRLCSNFKFETISEPDGIIQQVIDYIDHNLNNCMSADGICEHFNHSGRQLNAIFKKNTGITLSKYIDLKKMQKAIDLHKNGHSLIHASIEAGFSSYEAFAYLYKKEYGTSPRKNR